MALINKPYTFSAGATIVAAEHNSNFDTIYNDYNGFITNANISASAGITDSKLAQLTTAGKVSGAAFTLLGSIPSGGGTVPTANLGSGSATSSTFLRGDQSWASATPTAATALSGSVIQTVYQIVSTVVTCATQIPFDNTIPQNGEGDQILTKAITPNNASNILRITVNASYSQSSGPTVSNTMALFQDSTASAIASAIANSSSAAYSKNTTLIYYMVAGTTSSTTFNVRLGPDAAITLYLNADNNGTARYNGTCSSVITIEEIKA